MVTSTTVKRRPFWPPFIAIAAAGCILFRSDIPAICILVGGVMFGTTLERMRSWR